MLFNSYAFLFLFLPVAWLGFFALARVSRFWSATWMALASVLFYGSWDSAYLYLLLGSIMANHGFGRWLVRLRSLQADAAVKNVLRLAVATNLSLLAYFKYANFFLDSVNAVTGQHWSIGAVLLPMGISFFTFTQIAFLVDTAQGKVKEQNVVHYLLFVTFFPHLIAGPVLHHKDMMPQFADESTYRVNWQNMATGLLLLTVGLCKKVLWADSLAPYATGIFDAVGSGGGAPVLPTVYEAWAGALAYTLQIYFDFSGYTDMALGVALMFNVRLPANFNSPYQATSIIEFWRRWHITLSSFLRDYLYIPLGGNRFGPWRRHVNLMATMLLGGLWHGAGWTFVVWGGLHGAFLVLNHLWRGWVEKGWVVWPSGWCTRALGGFVTFLAVVTAWVFFRAEGLDQAWVMIKAMYGIEARAISLNEVVNGRLIEVAVMSSQELARLIALGLLWVWLLPNSGRLAFWPKGPLATWSLAALVLIAFGVAVDRFGVYSPFLYFQF